MIINNPPVELAGRVWMLGTGAYPIYLIRGRDRGMLVEGGISALGPVLEQQLSVLGLPSDYIAGIVITHAHPDHVMAVPALRRLFPNLSVSASGPAAETLNSEKALTFFSQIDRALTESLYRRGQAAEPPADLAPETIRVDRVLRDGDWITVDDVPWQVVATPGHSACSISLFEPQSRTLIISDAAGYYIPELNYWWPNYFSDYADYIASLDRLAQFNAEALCLSHNGAVLGADAVAQFLAGAIRATRAYHQRIIEALASGTSTRELAEKLGAEIHALTNILPLDFFQKNCALLIKLSQKARESGTDHR